MKLIHLAFGLVGSAALAAPAVANEPAPQTNLAETAPARGARVHDGFYLRLATGFGPYSESIRQSGQDKETTVNGVATVSEFAIGGTVRPGLIIGGGVWTSTVLASDRTVRGPRPPEAVLDRRAEFSLVGPFFDYYTDARKGLHFQGAIGLANVRGAGLNGRDLDNDDVAIGGGVMLGVGYDWFVSDEWSLGILGRLALGIAGHEDANDKRWYHAVGATPSVLFTATYN